MYNAFMKQSNGLRRVAQTACPEPVEGFHVWAVQRVKKSLFNGQILRVGVSHAGKDTVSQSFIAF